MASEVSEELRAMLDDTVVRDRVPSAIYDMEAVQHLVSHVRTLVPRVAFAERRVKELERAIAELERERDDLAADCAMMLGERATIVRGEGGGDGA